MKRLALTLFTALAAVLLTVPAAQAAEFRGGQELSTVPSGQTVNDDLYIAGQTVTITGTVDGDLIVAGSHVTIDGTVTGNVWAVGSDVTINGTVGHGVRVGAGNFTLNGRVNGDVLLGSSQAEINSGAVIGRDLVVGAGQLTDRGSVGRNLKIAGDQIVIGGPINGSITARSGKEFTLASGAAVGGGISYRGPNELQRQPGSQVSGAIDYTKTQRAAEQRPSFGSRLYGQIYWFLAALLLLLAILLYARRAAVRGADLIGQHPGGTILAGLGFLVLTPIIGFILLITVVGLPLSVITFFGYWLVLYTAKLFPALAIGRLIFRDRSSDSFWPAFAAGTVGLAIFYIVVILPVVGGMISLAALLFGTGAQLYLLREIFRANKKTYGA